MLSESDRGLAHAPGMVLIRRDAATWQFDNKRQGGRQLGSDPHR
jgi:hypothetical protein